MNGVEPGSVRVHATISVQQARQEVREGLEAKARLQQRNNLETEIAQHKQNVKDLTAARANLETGNTRRADTRAKLAAKQNLLNK